jgi:hypothetical protein
MTMLPHEGLQTGVGGMVEGPGVEEGGPAPADGAALTTAMTIARSTLRREMFMRVIAPPFTIVPSRFVRGRTRELSVRYPPVDRLGDLVQR